jgi:hypothetical protein
MGLIVILVGKPKTGKTVSACTFPKPLLILDWDKGVMSAFTAKDKSGELIVPGHDLITSIELFKKGMSPISFKSFAMVGDKAVPLVTPEYAKGAPEVMSKYNAIMQELEDTEGCITVDGKKFGPFATVVFDPLTQMFRVWHDALLCENSIMETRRGDYKALSGIFFNQFSPMLKTLSTIVPYTIVIDHEDFDTDEKGNIINEFPVGPSKKIGKLLSEAFDEVWRMECINDTYKWRTRKHGNFIGAGSRLSLPDPISPATFTELSKYLPKEMAK